MIIRGFDKNKKAYKIDMKKIETAKKEGYDVLVIWENDFLNNRKEIIEKCKEFLDG